MVSGNEYTIYWIQLVGDFGGRGEFVSTKDFQWVIVHCDYAHWTDQYFQLTVILTETGERPMSILHLDSRSADQNAVPVSSINLFPCCFPGRMIALPGF